jgi:hypothetical protein
MSETFFADPLNEEITSDSFSEERQRLVNQVASYRKSPLSKRLLWVFVFLMPLIIILCVMTRAVEAGIIVFIVVIGCVFYYSQMMEFQREVITMLLCEAHGWVLNPNEDHYRALKLGALFPDIFDRGDPDKRNVDNQIWGTFGKDNSINFWSAIFYYEVNETYDENGEKNTIPLAPLVENSLVATLFDKFVSGKSQTGSESNYFNKQVFVFQLAKNLPTGFLLTRKGRQRTFKTESVEFNKAFHILSNDESKQARLQILQILSPSVQVRLTDFTEKFDLDSIEFQENCMIVLFNDRVWEAKYTNFFRRVTIDERDVKRFEDLLSDMTSLPLEIEKFVD